MSGFTSDRETDIRSKIKSKFAPVFEIKSTGPYASPESKPLDLAGQELAWNTLLMVVPEFLAHCAGITTQSGHRESSHTLELWDFMNGREISIGVNRHGGYNLNIRAEEIRWEETQLNLDFLFLKLLALDYTPEDFRVMMG